MACATYLLVAQQDTPLRGPEALAKLIPVLPVSPRRCFQVTWAAFLYLWTCVANFWVVIDWAYQYRHYSRTKRGESPFFDKIPYALPFSREVLDVYPPDLQARHGKAVAEPVGLGIDGGAPVVILVPAPIVPVRILCHRKAYLQFALTLRKMGYCVVVPDITYFPDAKVRRSVVDLRLALSWVGAHISHYGGDPTRIYLMGFELSAHLISLTLVQEAVVLSHTLLPGNEDAEDAPTLPKGLEIYVPQVRIPQVTGVILLSGISDVVQQYRHQMISGVEHISYLRRHAGPSHTQCQLHSPAQLVLGALGVLDPSFLPPKFLLIHGGMDQVVPFSQSTVFANLLREAKVPEVTLRAYRHLAHTETLLCLLRLPRWRPSPYAALLHADLAAFIS